MGYRKPKDITEWARGNLNLPDAPGELLLLKEWEDTESEAKGWLAKWGDPKWDDKERNLVTGGGVRMRKGGTAEEAMLLASTMFVKFGIAGPDINGSKFVIDFDNKDDRRMEVLKRFCGAFLDDLERNTGTAGDLGISEEDTKEVLLEFDIPHPQWGIAHGIGLTDRNKPRAENEVVKRLNEDVSFDLKNMSSLHRELAEASPSHKVLVDVTAGWSTFVSARFMFEKRGKNLKGKRIAVQGVGAVGGSAAYYLEEAGADIVALSDVNGITYPDGKSILDILGSIDPKGRFIPKIPGINQDKNRDAIYDCDVDCLVLAAASNVVNDKNVSKIRVPIIIEGANDPIVPEADRILFEKGILVAPDFIVNAGTAELFTIAMLRKKGITGDSILETIKEITENALQEALKLSEKEHISLREAGRILSKKRLWKKILERC